MRILAYINPQAGSLIHQLIIAGLLGGSVAIKLAWNQIKSFCKKTFSRQK